MNAVGGVGTRWAQGVRNNGTRTRSPATLRPDSVSEYNEIAFYARERGELENRWAQALGGSSPSPSAETDGDGQDGPGDGRASPITEDVATTGRTRPPVRGPCPSQSAPEERWPSG